MAVEDSTQSLLVNKLKPEPALSLTKGPRRRLTSKSFADDGEGSKLIYKLLVHPR